MSIDTTAGDRTPMSQRERDLLKVLHTVRAGERTQAEAARLLRLSVPQGRRIPRRLEDDGDPAGGPRLRGQPSHRRVDPHLRQPVLSAYRRDYADFGPPLAGEQVAAAGLQVAPETLRRWRLAGGLGQRRRPRDPP